MVQVVVAGLDDGLEEAVGVCRLVRLSPGRGCLLELSVGCFEPVAKTAGLKTAGLGAHRLAQAGHAGMVQQPVVGAFLKRHTGALQGFDQNRGLALGAVQHGKIRERQILSLGVGRAAAVDREETVAAEAALQGLDDEFGLGFFGRRLMDGDQTRRVFEHRLGRGGGHQLGREPDDIAVGAIVAAQPHDLSRWKVALKLREKAHIRAPEAIDGLVRVANRADVAIGRNEVFEEPDLLLIDILVLVDGHPAVALPIRGLEGRSGGQSIGRPDHQVVKVEQVVGIELVLVGRVGCAQLAAGGRCRPGPLGAGDGRQLAARFFGRYAESVPEQAQALGVRGEPKAALQTGRVPVGLEDGQGQGVKRSDRQRSPPVGQQASQARAQLVGRPAGEGQSQTLGRRDGLRGDELDQPVGQGSGFSRAGTGHNQQRAARDFGRPALVGVEPGQTVGRAVGRALGRAGGGRHGWKRTGRVVGGCAIYGRLLGGRRRSRRIGRGLSKQRRPAVVAAQLGVVEQANSAVHAVVAGRSDYFLFAQPRHRLGHQRGAGAPDIFQRQRGQQLEFGAEPAQQALVVVADFFTLGTDPVNLGQHLGQRDEAAARPGRGGWSFFCLAVGQVFNPVHDADGQGLAAHRAAALMLAGLGRREADIAAAVTVEVVFALFGEELQGAAIAVARFQGAAQGKIVQLGVEDAHLAAQLFRRMGVGVGHQPETVQRRHPPVHRRV